MIRFSSIDLSRLPAPEVILTADVDTLLAEMKQAAIERHPELAPVLELESEPATKILRVCAYMRHLDRLEFNDGARANMLALATGTDLDQLAAFWGVERLTVQKADNTLSPPVPEIREADGALRARTQLSMEAHTTAGSVGGYLFWALSADGKVKDASITSPNAGEVLVSILSHDDDGVPNADLLGKVSAALNAEDVRPLTDQVTVQAATKVAFDVTAELVLRPGPDPQTVEAAAMAALDAYLADAHRIGRDVTVSGLHAALHQPGVQNVVLTSPSADIEVGPTEAAFCRADVVSVRIGGA